MSAAAVLVITLSLASPGGADGDVETRIAEFWRRIGALRPTDRIAGSDVGQWALNLTDRDPGAAIRVGVFRDTTARMQAAFDDARASVPVGSTPQPSAGPDVERRILEFWRRTDSLRETDYLTATDVGQWALNVIDRDPSASIRVDGFRAITATMQAAFDLAHFAEIRVPSGDSVTLLCGAGQGMIQGLDFVSLDMRDGPPPTSVSVGGRASILARVNHGGLGQGLVRLTFSGYGEATVTRVVGGCAVKYYATGDDTGGIASITATAVAAPRSAPTPSPMPRGGEGGPICCYSGPPATAAVTIAVSASVPVTAPPPVDGGGSAPGDGGTGCGADATTGVSYSISLLFGVKAVWVWDTPYGRIYDTRSRAWLTNLGGTSYVYHYVVTTYSGLTVLSQREGYIRSACPFAIVRLD